MIKKTRLDSKILGFIYYIIYNKKLYLSYHSYLLDYIYANSQFFGFN